MLLFLKTIQVLSVIFAIISLPFIPIGGIVFTIPMVAAALITEQAIRSKQNHTPMTDVSRTMYTVGAILGGLASGFGVFFLGSLEMLDTGERSSGGIVFTIIGILVAIGVTIGLLKAGKSLQK